MASFRGKLIARSFVRTLATQSSSRNSAVSLGNGNKYGIQDGIPERVDVGTSNATRSKPNTAPPLSLLPTGVLMRSLFVNSISSKPYFLSPAISFMDFLCQPGKWWLFDVNRNKFLTWVIKKLVYTQFCAGETAQEVQSTLKEFRGMGFRGTMLTYAREIVFDYNRNSLQVTEGETSEDQVMGKCPGIDAWHKGVLETMEMLGKGDQLAVKITGAGPLVTEALAAGESLPKQMSDALRDVSEQCKRKHVRLLIDAESQKYQFGILQVGIDLMKEYNRDGYALVYNTYQAYLKSTVSSLEKHFAAAVDGQFTLGLKLVRGAYLGTEKRCLIHDTKQDTDDSYNTIAHGSLRKDFCNYGVQGGQEFPSLNLLLCGHNKQSVFSANALHQERLRQGLPTVPVGYAQLHGMSDEVSLGLLQLGLAQGHGIAPEVYKCSTWGNVVECLGYLTRRARENRDAAGRTVDEYKALKAEIWRRLVASFGRSGRM